MNTIPILRTHELQKYIEKAEISHALSDKKLIDELQECAETCKALRTIVGFDGSANHDAELDRLALEKPVSFYAVRTGRDDVALLGFKSGSTGDPKATMHCHRDLLIIADGYAKEILGVKPDDIFVDSPPLAFTFGLGGLAIFPLRFGATATPLEQATICFTAPTAYRLCRKLSIMVQIFPLYAPLCHLEKPFPNPFTMTGFQKLKSQCSMA